MLDYSPDIQLGPNGLSEYGESFIDFIESSNLDNIRNKSRIIKACRRLEEKFEGKKRKTGEDYHSHPYEVARIYIEIHGNRISENGLIASILHDNIEDIADENYEEIEKDFGKEVSFLVELLSKPELELFKGDKKARNSYYFGNFKSLNTLKSYITESGKERGFTKKVKNKGPKRTNLNKGTISKSTIRRFAFIIGLIKICDRVHNLLTMPHDSYSLIKIEEKIEETEFYFTQLAHELYKTHPLIIDRLRKSILNASRLVNRLKVESLVNN